MTSIRLPLSVKDLLAEEAMLTDDEFIRVVFDKICTGSDLAVPFSEAAFKGLVGAYT